MKFTGQGLGGILFREAVRGTLHYNRILRRLKRLGCAMSLGTADGTAELGALSHAIGDRPAAMETAHPGLAYHMTTADSRSRSRSRSETHWRSRSGTHWRSRSGSIRLRARVRGIRIGARWRAAALRVAG